MYVCVSMYVCVFVCERKSVCLLVFMGECVCLCVNMVVCLFKCVLSVDMMLPQPCEIYVSQSCYTFHYNLFIQINLHIFV